VCSSGGNSISYSISSISGVLPLLAVVGIAVAVAAAVERTEVLIAVAAVSSSTVELVLAAEYYALLHQAG
jgi:hypothetical protein